MKKYLRFAAVASVSAVMCMGVVSCKPMDSGMTMSGEQLSKPDKDIVEIATGDNMGEVSTLVTAVKAAGLVDALKGEGPFTVFAPTNEAFAKLPPGKLDELLKPENKEKLKALLLYHVHPGKVMSSQVMTMSASTLDGSQMIDVTKDSSGVMLNGKAKVIKADIVAKNGVIHWIDTVIMPKDMM